MLEVKQTQALAAWAAERVGRLCGTTSTRLLRVFPPEAARQPGVEAGFAVSDVSMEAAPNPTLATNDGPLKDAILANKPVAERMLDGYRVLIPLCAADEVRHVVELGGIAPDAWPVPLACDLIPLIRAYYDHLADAETDPLTRLAHRRLFYSQVGAAMAPRAHGAPRRYLAMADIDHFKHVNDRFGHLYGDEILIHFAALMRKTFRAGDLLYRFGGEEFVILFAARGSEEGRVPLERFRTAVENYAFPRVGRITASIGFAAIEGARVPATTLIDRADNAVYYAKRNGRNRVCEYEALVASGELVAPENAAGGEATLF